MFVEYQLFNGHVVKAYNDYNEALKEANEQNLLLAEYGDLYGSDISYAFWNKTGNRNEDEIIIAYYRFDKNGKPCPISEQELKHVSFN